MTEQMRPQARCAASGSYAEVLLGSARVASETAGLATGDLGDADRAAGCCRAPGVRHLHLGVDGPAEGRGAALGGFGEPVAVEPPHPWSASGHEGCQFSALSFDASVA